jgi:hypothetical protein
MSANLNPEKALIFRIVHRDNLPWIFEHGLHARNGELFDPKYRNIGNPDLMDRRSRRVVPIPPGGTLSDYVPFYFTPFSIMMFNIKTGYGGIKHVPNEEIAILVSSLHRVKQTGNTVCIHESTRLSGCCGILQRSLGTGPDRLASATEPELQTRPR